MGQVVVVGHQRMLVSSTFTSSISQFVFNDIRTFLFLTNNYGLSFVNTDNIFYLVRI